MIALRAPVKYNGSQPAGFALNMVRGATMLAVTNVRTGRTVSSSIDEAKGALKALRGLMFRKEMSADAGMIFRPAKGIHTHFMRFPIDLIYLDRNDTVSKIRPAMPPWRFDFTNASGVIEMNAGAAAAHDIQVGDKLTFMPA